VRDSIDRHVAVWAEELAGLDPIREAIIARLAILSRHIGQVRRNLLTESGLKHWQFKVLLKLRQAGPPYTASPSDLAEQLGLTRGALSARLGSLVAAGLVTRTRDTADQRRVHVTLTRAGYLAFERHASSEGAGEDALLLALSARERTTLANLLRKVVHSLENP
jgi:DNA-binding MarR family transcriptional regulator